jgi:formate dehydrogenase maturation protein FdhE
MEHPTKEELKKFEKAKEVCPFCGEKYSAVYTGDSKTGLYFSCCDRVLVCNDLGLFEETDE